MDPYRMKLTAQWFRSAVFKEEPVRPGPARPAVQLPSLLLAARSLEGGSWQSRESLFLKQARLLAGYEDAFDCGCGVRHYYPTYQSLTDEELRGYFSWRTRLRKGEVQGTALSFAFLYIYELLNQAGVEDPMDGYRKLEEFRDAYGQIDPMVLPYLKRWLFDYAVYYELDPALLSDTPQAVFDRNISALEHIHSRDVPGAAEAVRQLSGKWLARSRFYAAHREDMDTVTVRVLRRMRDHYAARCKKTLVEHWFGPRVVRPVRLFDTAVFCDPLKKRTAEYAVDEQCVYRCDNGQWTVEKYVLPPRPNGELDALLKTIDAMMRLEFDAGRPIKAPLETKWIVRMIQDEIQAFAAEKRAAEEQVVSIDYSRLAKIRQDAAITREKLIVEEEAPEPSREPPAAPEPAGQEPPLTPAEYRLLQCLLYGGDCGWVQREGHLLSVLADGVNEKLYDVFSDAVLDEFSQPVEDYIDDLKEMIHP